MKVINSYMIIKESDNDNDGENNAQNKDNERY